MKLKIFIIMLLIQTNIIFCKSAEEVSDTENLNIINKILKKTENIESIYAEIKTKGYTSENDTVNIKIKYWKQGNKIKKMLFDGYDTITTLILGDTFYIYYENAEMLLKNRVSSLTKNEYEQFRLQNYIIDYRNYLKEYKFDILKTEKSYLLINNKINFELEKIIIEFDRKTLDLTGIEIIIKNEINKLNKYRVNIKEYIINPEIQGNIFRINDIVQEEFYKE
jgi:hypothetical protein